MFRTKRAVRELLILFLVMLCAILLSGVLLVLNRSSEQKQLKHMTERNFCAAHIYENLLGLEHALGAGGSQAGRGEAYREQSGRLEQNLQDMAVLAADSERLIGYVQQIGDFQRRQERLWRETDGDQAVSASLELLEQQKLCAQNLIDENFRVSSEKYLEDMRVIDRQRLTVWGCVAVILFSGMILTFNRLRQLTEAVEENLRATPER